LHSALEADEAESDCGSPSSVASVATDNVRHQTRPPPPLSSLAVRFNADQVTCLCEALQQAGDLDRLARFIASLGPAELAAGGESVLRARAAVAFHQSRYSDLFAILEGHHFEPAGHPWLQQLWYRAHYAEAEKARGRPLGQYDSAK
jgi:homeobox protein SIX4